MTDVITIKRGTSLDMEIQWATNGVGVDLTGYTVTSQVRKRDASGDGLGTLVADITCTIDPDQVTNPGVVLLEADTSDWPILALDCDVKFVSGGGLVYPTTTFEIRVVRNITA